MLTDEELKQIKGRVACYYRHMIQLGQLYDSMPAARKRFAESSERDIPALIAEVERCHAEIQRLKEENESLAQSLKFVEKESQNQIRSLLVRELEGFKR